MENKKMIYKIEIQINGEIMETEVTAKSIEEVEEIIRLNTSILKETKDNKIIN